MNARARLALLTVVAVLAAAVAFRAPLLRALVCGIADVVTGSRVSIGALQINRDHAVIWNIHVQRRGDPLFDAERVDVAYRLRDLLPGGNRRFGLVSFSVAHPRITIVRKQDGSFNFSGGQSVGASPAGPASAAVPLEFNGRVRDGTILLLDAYRLSPDSRAQRLDHIDADLAVNSTTLAHYDVRGDFEEAGPHRLHLVGTVDERRGYALQHLVARELPLSAVLNYVINSNAAHFFGGDVRNLDVRAYALGIHPDQDINYHLSGSAELNNAALLIAGFAAPLQSLRGNVTFFDGGLATNGVEAQLAGAPVHVLGGLYGLSDPHFRLFLRGAGELAQLRTSFFFSRAYPLRGGAAIDAEIEGPVGDPLVLVRVNAPHTSYGPYAIDAVGGLVTYYRGSVDLAPGTARYGAIDFSTRGEIALSGDNPARLAIQARAPAAGIPYLAQIVPHAQLEASALLAGPAGAYDTRAIVSGLGGGESLMTLLHVDTQGDGAFAPVIARRADGTSLAGGFFLDRAHDRSAFWLDSERYVFTQSPQSPRLPGLANWSPPDFAGRFDGVVGGAGTPSSFALAGVLHARDFQTAGVPFDEVALGFSGSPTRLRLGSVAARGPWGNFDGTGGYADGRLAARGTYRGSFERLRVFTGDLGARGPVAGPVALYIEPGRTVVQTGGASIVNAAVQGAPITHFAGTIELRDRQLRVDGATVAVAGGTMAAAGSLLAGHQIGISAAGIDAAQLHSAGVPLRRGRIAAVGGFTAAGGPRFSGSLLVANGRYGSYDLAGNGDVDVRRAQAQLGTTEVLVGDTYGVLDGSLAGLGSSSPTYDVQLSLRGADIGTLVGLTGRNPWYLGGTLDADVHVSGSGRAPAFTGDVRVPEGTVNGMRFHDGSARIDANHVYATIEDGQVGVGSTDVAFAGGTIGDDGWLRLDVARADLSDFNDFFDAGDTLGGKGRIIFDFSHVKTATQTSADVSIAALRYRRFPLGDAVARWQTAGPNVDGSISFGGASGRLTSDGRIVLAHGGSLRTLMERSSYNVNTSLRDLDLGIWLPTLGYHLPIAGRLDGDGVVRGRYPALALSGTIALQDGSIGKFPVNKFSITATSDFDRMTVSNADLEIPGLSVYANGSAALAPQGPLDLTFRATSPQVGTFADRIFGRALGFEGNLTAQVSLTGTRDHPRSVGGFDVESASIGGVSVPRIVGSVAIDGRDAVLRDAEITLSKGSLSLAGAIPFIVLPFGIGPPAAPVGLDVAAHQIDLSAFAALLPPGSEMGGLLDGRIAIDGTAAAPQLRGELALSQGTLVTPFEQAPLRNIGAKFNLGGSRIQLLTLHADAGSGTLDADGSAVLADLVHPSTNTRYVLDARVAHAALDFPAYGAGIVDGTLTLSHEPGAPALIAGSVSASDATIPFAALYHPDTGFGLGGAVSASSDLAFDINATAGRNVRVHSANLDIGAIGTVNVGGTLESPALLGSFTSTGGTLAYFNRVFRVIDGTVTFERDLGIVPLLDARATTHVFDPASFTGSTDITLTLTGPVTNLTIALDTPDGYDREQILALLLNAPELGTLIANGTVARGQSGNLIVNQEAFSIVNAQFTRALLAPFESAFGQALGLSNLNFDFDYGGSVNVSARKLLGKSLNAIYATNVSYPYRQSFGFELRPNQYTSAQLTLYQSLGQATIGTTPATNVGITTNGTLLSQPPTGTNGVSFSFLRYLP